MLNTTAGVDFKSTEPTPDPAFIEGHRKAPIDLDVISYCQSCPLKFHSFVSLVLPCLLLPGKLNWCL